MNSMISPLGSFDSLENRIYVMLYFYRLYVYTYKWYYLEGWIFPNRLRCTVCRFVIDTLNRVNTKDLYEDRKWWNCWDVTSLGRILRILVCCNRDVYWLTTRRWFGKAMVRRVSIRIPISILLTLSKRLLARGLIDR